MNERPRFSAVLSRIGQQIARLPDEQRAKVRADFAQEVAAAKAENRPIKPSAFLGDGQTGAEAADAFEHEFKKTDEGGRGRPYSWAVEHGAQAFANFIPALDGVSSAN